MRLFLFFLFVALTGSVCAQNTIEWSASYKLSTVDFVASPHDTLVDEMHAGIFVSYHIHTLHLFRKNFNDNISSHFEPSSSFLRSPDSVEVRFARTLFDLSEVMARELRKEFAKGGRMIFAHKAQALYQLVNTKFNALHDQYQQESERARNNEKQLYWEKWIEAQLFELRDFSKNVSSSKVVLHNGPPRYQR